MEVAPYVIDRGAYLTLSGWAGVRRMGWVKDREVGNH